MLNTALEHLRPYQTKNALRALFVLLGLNLILFILHILFRIDVLESRKFNISEEGGFGEIFMYFNEGVIALIFGYLAFKKRSLLFLGWSLLFLYFLLDDSMQLHERVGEELAESLNLPEILGMRSVDLGELMVYAGVSLPVLFFIVWGYWRSEDAAEREIGLLMFLLLLPLMGFGAGVDMLHSIFGGGRVGNALFGFVEDGGESIIMSLITVFGVAALDRFGVFGEKPTLETAPAAQ